MQLRIGTNLFDLDRRPLVVARLSASVTDQVGLLGATKQAVGQGADMVEVPARDLTATAIQGVDAAGVGVVGLVRDVEEITGLARPELGWGAQGSVRRGSDVALMPDAARSQVAAVQRAPERQNRCAPSAPLVRAVRWDGPDPMPRSPWPGLTVFSTRLHDICAGGGLIVAPDALEQLAAVPAGAIGIVDMGEITDRAAVAALVTVALELGATGFITDFPSPVRRAAHVIRAVEHAE